MKRLKLDDLLLPATTAVILFVDQVSKHLVTTWLKEGQCWDVAPWLTPILRLTHVTNTGAAFGLFPRWGNLFVVVAALVILMIVVYYWNLSDGQWLVRIALGLQLGGALGNLIDRLRWGFVVDFIDLNFWPLHNWPVFNLADASIVAGVVLLGLLMMWEEQRGRGEHRIVGLYHHQE